jgi:hypothetical protein
MSENLEIRKVANGYILSVTSENGETVEFIYDTVRKLMSAVKLHLNA